MSQKQHENPATDSDSLFGPAGQADIDFFNFGQDAGQPGSNTAGSNGHLNGDIPHSDQGNGTDFFDSILAEKNTENYSGTESHSSFPAENGTVHDISSLSGYQEAYSNPAGQQPSTGYDPYATGQQQYNSYDAAPATQAPVDDDYENAGWYDDDGQWHPYDEDIPTTTWNATPQTNTTTTQSNSYAPPVNNAYTPASYAPSSYAPYTPAAPAVASPYTPSNAYSPYTPTTSTPAHAAPASVVPTPRFSIPPPPAPATSITHSGVPQPSYKVPPPVPDTRSAQDTLQKYRMSTPNAFDPPVIASRRPSRIAQHQAPQAWAAPTISPYAQPQAPGYGLPQQVHSPPHQVHPPPPQVRSPLQQVYSPPVPQQTLGHIAAHRQVHLPPAPPPPPQATTTSSSIYGGQLPSQASTHAAFSPPVHQPPPSQQQQWNSPPRGYSGFNQPHPPASMGRAALTSPPPRTSLSPASVPAATRTIPPPAAMTLPPASYPSQNVPPAHSPPTVHAVQTVALEEPVQAVTNAFDPEGGDPEGGLLESDVDRDGENENAKDDEATETIPAEEAHDSVGNGHAEAPKSNLASPIAASIESSQVLSSYGLDDEPFEEANAIGLHGHNTTTQPPNGHYSPPAAAPSIPSYSPPAQPAPSIQAVSPPRPPQSYSTRSSIDSQRSSAYDPPFIPSRKDTAGSRAPPPQPVYNPYAPTSNSGPPLPPPTRNDPYAPSSHRKDSIASSNGSVYGGPVVGYAPVRRQASDISEYSTTSYPSRNTYTPTPPPFTNEPSTVSNPSYSPTQQFATHAGSSMNGHAYAPSPSLSGANDLLGRASSRAPLISFGFGGKLLTYFLPDPSLGSGFDVSLSSRKPLPIQSRKLHQIIPSSAIDTSTSKFPGPLFSDPGTPTMGGIVRTGSGSSKSKKPLVIKYLNERAVEIEGGLGYLSDVERRKAEGKLTLVKLLCIMVENDGKLTGSPQVEAQVRLALVPETGITSDSTSGSFGFTPAAAELSASYGSVPGRSEEPVAVYTVRPSVLDKLQGFLLRGERKLAYHYALDEKLWAHAMLIASSMDKDAFKEVVNEFIKSELGVQVNNQQDPKLANGRESLRVAYSLFAGHGAAAVQELLPPKVLGKTGEMLMPPPAMAAQPTPVSPNFPQPTITSAIPTETLARWQETAATIFANQITGETSALTTLGDYLAANKWIEAAHTCYMLSPKTSPVAGLGAPSVRIVLLGSDNPRVCPTFNKDIDAFIFSEIAEFAMSLMPVIKGQDTFPGLPHLQAYRLIRAVYLAEMGYDSVASRYCDAISATLRLNTRPSPYYTTTFTEQLDNLTDRLSGAPLGNASWAKKMPKASLDTLGNWVGGRLTKFIAGDGDDSPVAETEKVKRTDKTEFVGPFSHYSSISSTTPSQTPSPTGSFANLANAIPPPQRSGSAMAASRPILNPLIQIERSASVMDYTRPTNQKSSAVPQIFSANAATTTFFQADVGYQAFTASRHQSKDSYSTGQGQSVEYYGAHSGEDSGSTPTAASFKQADDEVASSGQFVSLMDAYSPMPSPAATNFSKPANGSAKTSSRIPEDEEDDEDLGFGNNSGKRKAKPREDESEESQSDSAKKNASDSKKPEPPKTEEAKPASSSWLGRWWTRRDPAEPAQQSGAPIKAKLGDESTFYYDKELKRWVNKKAGDTPTPTATPPPPPSRPQTSSPKPTKANLGEQNDFYYDKEQKRWVNKKADQNGSAVPPSPTPPPPRAQTASPSRSLAMTSINPPPPSPGPRSQSTVPPPARGPTPRPRSQLSESFVPNSEGDSDGTIGTDGSLKPPPARKAGSAAARKNLRARYVDVFQSEAS